MRARNPLSTHHHAAGHEELVTGSEMEALHDKLEELTISCTSPISR